jgi:hypothetical protein
MAFRGFIQISRYTGPVFGLGPCDTGVWIWNSGQTRPWGPFSLIQHGPQVPSQKAKRPENMDDHLPPSSVKVSSAITARTGRTSLDGSYE